MKQMLRTLLVLILLLAAVAALAEEPVYQTLRLGDKGPAVDALKYRMYELGYFSSTKFSVEFNETTRDRLIELQKKNGLTPDGVATPEVQALIFSDACLPRDFKPTATPAPTPGPGETPAPGNASSSEETNKSGEASEASEASEANKTGEASESGGTLKLGDKGPEVNALKLRMYELGYFSTKKFSIEFNETTRDRLMDLQRHNGLTPDGVATPELLAYIFSDACRGKKDAPVVTPVPTPAGMPETDADGYLPEGAEPYVFASREMGQWYYISQGINIEIMQHKESSPVPLIWLEITIRMKDPASLTSLLSPGNRPGRKLTLPKNILAEYDDVILAFSDDFYGYRISYKDRVGVIIRNGEALFDDPRIRTSKFFPPLDILAVFEDGSMKTFISDEHTAQEYLDMGVRDTFAFGPILVQDGQLMAEAAEWSIARNPRLAMGILPDGTVKVVNVLGRRTDSKGVNVEWMAAKMHELGCVEALNLDGGNTACVLFMGEIINRPKNVSIKDIRYVNSLIGIQEVSE